MDQVGSIMARASFEALKEPRGFIKFLEFILAIFAFATTTSYSSHMSITVYCCPADKKCDAQPKLTISWSYPFRLDENTFPTDYCSSNNATTAKTMGHPYGDFSSSAEFYVFVGVMGFLYSIAALVLYIFFDDHYRNNTKIPKADFIVSALLTLMWLISSSAWAQGLTDLKYYSSANEIYLRHLEECKQTTSNHCESEPGNYASLNVSIIFGFLNMGVWAGNLWFLFKETAWHKDQHSPSPNAMPSPSSADKSGQSSYGGDIYNSSNPYGGPGASSSPFGGPAPSSNPYGGPAQGNPYGSSQPAPSYMGQPSQGRI